LPWAIDIFQAIFCFQSGGFNVKSTAKLDALYVFLTPKKLFLGQKDAQTS
jgi:hypothetical protein